MVTNGWKVTIQDEVGWNEYYVRALAPVAALEFALQARREGHEDELAPMTRIELEAVKILG